jgi:hypothetical protein
MSRNEPMTNINRPSFPPIQQPRLLNNRTIINPTTIDPVIVGKLFLLCIEGKISSIKEYIIKNGLTVNDMVDTNGESILHKVLQNENLLKRDKIELFRFFEEKNLLKMSYDTTLTTPLHLAVKMQIKEIVQILLRAGHNINAVDVNGKTPLFYAVSGKIQDCPPKKEKVLLEKTKLKLEKSDTYVLVQELIKIINKEESLFNLFIHIGNSCSILDQIFSSTVKNILEKDNKQILDVLKTNDTQDQKIKKIFDLINDTKMSIGNAIIKNELQTCLKPMQFQQNTIGGWGPDSNPQNKILQTGNESDFLKKFDIEMDDKIKKTLTQLKLNRENLFKESENIKKLYIKPSEDILNEFNYTYQIICILSGHGQTGYIPHDINANEILTYFKSDLPIPITFINRNIDSNVLIDVTNDGTKNLPLPVKPDYSNNRNLNANRNAVRRMLEDINNNHFIGINPLLAPVNNGDYYTKKSHMIYDELIQIINVNIKTIEENITTNLNKKFDKIDSKVILLECIDMQKELLSLLNYLVLMQDEIETIDNKNDKLKKLIEKCIEEMQTRNINGTGGQVHKGHYYFSEVQENANLKLENFEFMQRKKKFETIYSLIEKFYLSINSIIELLNDINATKYMKIYFNDFNDFDTFFTSLDTNDIDEIFYNKIDIITKIPSKFNDFIMLLSNDEIQNKRTLIETFLYQVHSNSFNSYYNNTNPNSLPRIGFLLNDTAGINAASNLVPLNLSFGMNTSDARILDSALPDLRGLIGNLPSKTNKKRDEAIPVIGKNLSDHFNIIKYYIVRYILKLSHELLLNKMDKIRIVDAYTEYAEIIYKMYIDIQAKLQLNQNDFGPLLIIIGTCIDKIITSNIENSIMSGINRFSYRTNRNNNTNTILNLLAQLKTDNSALLHKENFDIANYLKDTKFLVEDIKKNLNKILKSLSYNEYLYNYAEDIFEKKIEEIKILKKFSQNILDNEPSTCYSLDYDIIQLLLLNKANVSIKDKEGSNILFSAIDMNNFELIQQIIRLVPVYNKHSKNIFGKTPLDHSSQHLLYFTEMFLDENIIKDLVNISSEIISKKTQVSLQLRYHTEIYKIILILINHYIYSMGKEYINGWSNAEQASLDNFLNMGKLDIPLLDSLNSLESVDKDRFLLDYVDEDLNKNNLQKIKILAIQEQIRNLTEELRNPAITPIRNKVITQTINKLQNELNSSDLANIDTEIDDMNKAKTEINIRINFKTGMIKLKNNPTQINTDNLITLYDSIQEKIINSTKFGINNDYKTYINLWKKSIKDKNYSDINLIQNISNFINNHTKIDDKIQDTIQDKIQNKIQNKIQDKIQDKLQDTIQNKSQIELIKNYFDKIIKKICLDYNELDYSFDGNNYVLNMIVKIIKHVLSNTVGVNLLNIIQQLLREELRMKYPYNSDYTNDLKYTKLIDEKVKQIIISSDIQGLSLDKYIMDEMIEKIIKINLNLFEDSYDKDNMEDINNIFIKISKLLESNTVLSLSISGKDGKDESNNIMKELKEKIYPYFKDYLETNIKLIKRFIDGYMNSLINYGSCLNIYSIILQKAFDESKIRN